MMHFATGFLGTLTMSSVLPSQEGWESVSTQLLSLAGGVISALLTAWLEHRWKRRDK